MTVTKPQSINSLLKQYNKKTLIKAKKLKFLGVGKRDVYNVAAPFKFKRSYYLLGRVESREEETGTKVMFFRRPQHSQIWHVDDKCPIFDLQDPFIIRLKGTFVLGGIETKQFANRQHLRYRTVFYRGKDIHNLRKFSNSPWGMKGIRFIKLLDGQVLVFTRPQGKKGRRGKIGCTVIDSLNKLTPRTLSQAGIIGGQFARGEWGGVNEVHFLRDGKIGILGHIAKFGKDKKKYYYPITFSLDFEMGAFSKLKIITRREDLPKGESKRGELYNVLYPGGIIRNGNGTAKLYVGVGDAEAYEITIEDPFLEYEANNVY
jgi:hypothetical protein